MENGYVTEISLFSKWEDNKGNIRNQEEYIPIFQKKNFLMDFDLGIYEKAFTYLQRWKREGKQIPVVNLNMTENSLWDLSVFDKLSELMERYDIQYKEVRIVLDRERFVKDNFDIDGLADHLKKRGFFILLTEGQDVRDKNSKSFLPAEDLEKLLKEG